MTNAVLRSLGNGLVVDLGSGLGRDLLGVAKAYPNLRIELHDKPEVIELAKEVSSRRITVGPIALCSRLMRVRMIDVVPSEPSLRRDQSGHFRSARSPWLYEVSPRIDLPHAKSSVSRQDRYL